MDIVWAIFNFLHHAFSVIGAIVVFGMVITLVYDWACSKRDGNK